VRALCGGTPQRAQGKAVQSLAGTERIHTEGQRETATTGNTGDQGSSRAGSGGADHRADFEADFEDCSYGFRPGRSAHQALEQIAAALKAGKTEVYDADLEATSTPYRTTNS